MQLFDYANQKLIPVEFGKTVRIYICGITPYDSAHLGHVFTFMTYDLLQRYLESKGHTVQMVRNITDVDEPIYKRAARNGEPYTVLAARETALFQDVMHSLNMRVPFAEPKASEYIDQMADAVVQLLESEHAYRLGNGDIYFDVSTYADFGKKSALSDRLKTNFMRDRGGDPDRADKRNPMDFLLWKAINDPTDEAAWDSPIGRGRPGWHIECSVMSTALLDTPLDIHGGGLDLIFPHHACEIAQSESLGIQPFVREWMYVAPIVYKGEKMSKSLGNLVFAKDLLAKYPPAVIRMALMKYHYRTAGEWRPELLDEMQECYALLQRAAAAPSGPDPAQWLNEFNAAFENDLDMPEILSIMMHLASAIERGGDNSNAPQALQNMLRITGLIAD